MDFIIWLCMAWITQVLVRGAPPEQDLRFKGVAKPFTLTPRTKLGRRVPVASSGRDMDYPEVLDYSLSIEGRESIDIHLARDLRMGIPMKNIRRTRQSLDIDNQNQQKEEAGFYRDTHGHGSFACRIRKDRDNDFLCDIYGLVTFEDETCFILPRSDVADCTKAKEGVIEYFKDTTEDTKPASNSPKSVLRNFRRRRRQAANGGFSLPPQGHGTVELAFVLDERFMDTFYQRHPNNIRLAQDEAEMLIILTTTEMNVFLSSLSKVTNGELEIYAYPSAIVYPVYKDNFNWSAANNDGQFLYRSDAMIQHLDLYAKSGFTEKQFDHVMFITGYDYHGGAGVFNGQAYVGFAYFRTVCDMSKKQFSFLEFDASQMAYIATHELGHTLGADHDEARGCRNGKYVMSQYMVSPAPFVVASTWEFSPCSAYDILRYLNSKPDCTAKLDSAFTDDQFQTKFCSGLLGQTQWSTDVQCQKLTGWSKSRACNVVNEFACSRGYWIRCLTARRICSSRLPQIWNGTPCGGNKMCFKGKCMEKFDICPGQ